MCSHSSYWNYRFIVRRREKYEIEHGKREAIKICQSHKLHVLRHIELTSTTFEIFYYNLSIGKRCSETFESDETLSDLAICELVSSAKIQNELNENNENNVTKSKNKKQNLENCLRTELTRMVFMCSFLIVFERPKNFFFIHCAMYQSDFGAGMILNGGGHVPPSSK